MPGRDGTGPLGRGTMSGKGFGLCSGMIPRGNGNGSGLGKRKGYGRFLASQKELLEKRIDISNKQIEGK